MEQNHNGSSTALCGCAAFWQGCVLVLGLLLQPSLRLQRVLIGARYRLLEVCIWNGEGGTIVGCPFHLLGDWGGRFRPTWSVKMLDRCWELSQAQLEMFP